MLSHMQFGPAPLRHQYFSAFEMPTFDEKLRSGPNNLQEIIAVILNPKYIIHKKLSIHISAL